MSIRLPKITVSNNINYIEAFLTYRCSMDCSYCINKFNNLETVKEINGYTWVNGLGRITTSPDLPITLGGGEPTLHPDFYHIVRQLHKRGKHLDLLTNGTFNLQAFIENIAPDIFRSNAPYAGIRFSLHKTTNVPFLIEKVKVLHDLGYSVGIWGVKHPSMSKKIKEVSEICENLGLDFRTKDYLGWHNGKLWGKYKYPEALSGKREAVICKGSELLINPAGNLFQCHHHLYSNTYRLASILDPELDISLNNECREFGMCNPCDIKLKFNRFQKEGHCSIEILSKDEGGDNDSIK